MIQTRLAKASFLKRSIFTRHPIRRSLCSSCGGLLPLLLLSQRRTRVTGASSTLPAARQPTAPLPSTVTFAGPLQVRLKTTTPTSTSNTRRKPKAKLIPYQKVREKRPEKFEIIDTNAAYGGIYSHQVPPFLAGTLPSPSEDPQLRKWAFNRETMTSHVEVISAPTADTPGSCLVVHFAGNRYLFGQMSEGTQRLMGQRKVPKTKISTMFMTGTTRWANNGGLLGMILTLATIIGDQAAAKAEQVELRKARGLKVNQKQVDEATEKELHIFGPENLTYVLATARRFIFRQSMMLKPHEIRGDPSAGKPAEREPDYKDENIRVWYMPIWPGPAPTPETGVELDPEHISPKKRSYDEMSSRGDENEPDFESMQPEERYKFLREVVSHMFESDWSIDEVIKTTLHKAFLPAKLFVKDDEGLLVKYEGPMPGDAPDLPDIEVWVRQPWPGAKINSLPPTKPSNQSLCYIAMTHPRRGKLNAKLAKELGVIPRDMGKLVAGETVTCKNGTVVTPDMVLGDPLPGQGFAVVDVPDVSYIDSLLARPEMSSDTVVDRLGVIYWFLGPGVVADPRIESYIQSHTKPKHIISAPDVVPNYLSLESPARVGIWLKMMDGRRFDDLHYNDVPSVTHLPGTSSASMPGRCVQLCPRLEYKEDDAVRILNKKTVVEGCSPVALALAKGADKVIADPEFTERIKQVEKDIPRRDAELITLGTGSALPSKYRNVSATLLRVPGVGNYLFDCGENTLGVMRRSFGPELPDVLRKLKFIWISHLHADHHLGTTSLIRAWHEETSRSAPDATLDVGSHWHMDAFLSEYSHVEDFGYASGKQTGRVKFHSLRSDTPSEKVCNPIVFPDEGGDPRTGLSRIDAVFVEHCHGALAVCLTFPGGLKVAYSGDCRPSDKFAEIARDATLLIHEATFSDEYPDEAIYKKHCTISEAMEVARKMRARRVMLTHFSQRYPKIAMIDDGSHAEVKDQAVLFAFDLMKVKLGDWRYAQQYWPALKEVFAEDEDEEKEKEMGEGEVEEEGKGEARATASSKKKQGGQKKPKKS